MNDKIITIGKRNPNLPFHPAVRAGDFIYVSGQVAKDENGNMSSGNIEEETRWTLEGIRRTSPTSSRSRCIWPMPAILGATTRSSQNTFRTAEYRGPRSRPAQ